MFLRTEYPRPQLRRDDWMPLNGIWEFAFDDAEEGAFIGYPTGNVPLDKKINVPFCYQTAASGIGDETEHAAVWYRRTFTAKTGRRALLCFNGCDYETDVWLNGHHVVSHTGAYTPFHADVTGYLKEENVLVVRCRDSLDSTQPRGKQSWKPEGKFACWYTPFTGIWQSVWLEYFGDDCVSALSLYSDFDACAFYGELTALRGFATEAEFTVTLAGEVLKKERIPLTGKATNYRISLEREVAGLAWSPERPTLLAVDVKLYVNGGETDEVHTRFGMRKITVDNGGNLLLNGERFYQRLILDQGYWQESGVTPPSVEAIRRDIEFSMQMGFNGARKHQKIEDPYYYYFADELGFFTWCEMPSAYTFGAREIGNFTREWTEIVRGMSGFASVVCYVPFNESWGVEEILSAKDEQNFVRGIYALTHALDGTRPISSNDGWECLSESDIIGVHDYAFSAKDFESKYDRSKLDTLVPQGRKLMAEGNNYRGQPVLLTEFGGIALRVDTNDGNWGYNSGAADAEEFFAQYEDLLKGIYACDFQGFCYTQLTDVQQEVNGLLYPDRTPKFDASRLKALNEAYGKRKE